MLPNLTYHGPYPNAKPNAQSQRSNPEPNPNPPQSELSPTLRARLSHTPRAQPELTAQMETSVDASSGDVSSGDASSGGAIGGAIGGMMLAEQSEDEMDQ